jgi:hypothetical protein
VRFEWDQAKAADNLAKHGVSFHEAATVFRDPLSATGPDPDHSLEEERFVTFGVSARGSSSGDRLHRARRYNQDHQCQAGDRRREEDL